LVLDCTKDAVARERRPKTEDLRPVPMPPSPTNPRTTPPHWLLRRADQALVAGFIALGLVTTVGWWVSRGGSGGRMIEVERAEPRTAQFQIDINRADWPELALLPGVGKVLAQRIVESRQTVGPFRDHGDLRRVRGIGPKTLEGIRPYLLPMADAETVATR
jgi:competence protein ComEA